MKKTISIISISIAVFVLSSTALASIDQFTGYWRNADPNTRGITTLDISVNGNDVTVHAWGRCHPSDCDWKNANEAHAFGPDVGADLSSSATGVLAVWNFGFADDYLVIHPLGNLLEVDTFTVFAPGDGRTNYESHEVFYRSSPPFIPVVFASGMNVTAVSAEMMNATSSGAGMVAFGGSMSPQIMEAIGGP